MKGMCNMRTLSLEKVVRNEWEIREDVATLMRAEEIKNDTSRMKDAQNYIRTQREAEYAVLKMKAAPSRKVNPATIGKL